MSEFHPRVLTGLSVEIAGVVIKAEIDEASKTVWLVQYGEPINGEALAIEKAVDLLAVRVKRTRPDLRLVVPGEA